MIPRHCQGQQQKRHASEVSTLYAQHQQIGDMSSDATHHTPLELLVSSQNHTKGIKTVSFETLRATSHTKRYHGKTSNLTGEHPCFKKTAPNLRFLSAAGVPCCWFLRLFGRSKLTIRRCSGCKTVHCTAHHPDESFVRVWTQP